MKPARILVICIAAVAAIGLALVVRAMGSGGSAGQPAAAAPVQQTAMAKVLVAAKDLEPGVRLSAADIQWKDWPADGVIPAFITDGSAPAPVQEASTAEKAGQAVAEVVTGNGTQNYVGAVVREPIAAGEPITTRKVVMAGDSGFMAAYLEPGTRAMAIRVTVETAAGGFILPGDRVDVVLTRELRNVDATPDANAARFAASTVMQNVKVLAIDQTTQPGDEKAVVGATATLAVGSADAEVLARAKSEGELSLVLRSYADVGGPSGRTMAQANEPRSVRIYRGGAAETVVVK